MQDNEAEWLIEAQNGDPQAFTYLVEKYQRPVYNLCYRMLGNAQDAEDAAQEAFFRAYNALNRYDRKRAFSSWLLAIAAHYCIDQMRKRRFKMVSVEELPVPDLPDIGPGMESKLSDKEERKNIRKLLDILEPKDRAAVILYYWYDYSYKEISDILDIPIGTVMSRISRGRKMLQKSLLDYAKKEGYISN